MKRWENENVEIEERIRQYGRYVDDSLGVFFQSVISLTPSYQVKLIHVTKKYNIPERFYKLNLYDRSINYIVARMVLPIV